MLESLFRQQPSRGGKSAGPLAELLNDAVLYGLPGRKRRKKTEG